MVNNATVADLPVLFVSVSATRLGRVRARVEFFGLRDIFNYFDCGPGSEFGRLVGILC